ncbi:uncharacterized protein LOC142351840 isoform X2 [Convolutriloba macropyga]|uniref:uncharacterized protein LOC142351840 isoform X2 n=1 Tax=Convolutriloba macropyga TaxID=536237 RepID=UPI003F5236B7
MRNSILVYIFNLFELVLQGAAFYQAGGYDYDYSPHSNSNNLNPNRNPGGSGGTGYRGGSGSRVDGSRSLPNTVYGFYSTNYENYHSNNKYSAVQPQHTKYQFKCYTCEEKDPNSDCAQGRLYPDAYPSIDCSGFCYVMSYTLYGTESRTTQRSCVPLERCIHSTNLCLSSYVDCDFNCCDSEFCNASSKLTPIFLFTSHDQVFNILYLSFLLMLISKIVPTFSQ